MKARPAQCPARISLAASEGRLRNRVGGMNVGRPRLPQMRAVADISSAGPGMILVTVSCATEAIRDEKDSHDIRDRCGP
jgi:hypothetical protein